MIVVVAVAALGGRMAGIVTALAAVASFDFFHTRPYLSMAIDSREDVETTVLLLRRRRDGRHDRIRGPVGPPSGRAGAH